MDDYFCCYCGRLIIPPLEKTIEHLVPLSKGGNNSKLNKLSCCQRCNNWRGNKSLSEWKQEIKYKFHHRKRLKAGYTMLDIRLMYDNIKKVQNLIEERGKALYK